MLSPAIRLERALRIALRRAHGESEPANIQHAALKIAVLEEDEEIRQKVPRLYEAWQDARRLVGALEILERAEGIEHVRVREASSFRAHSGGGHRQ